MYTFLASIYFCIGALFSAVCVIDYRVHNLLDRLREEDKSFFFYRLQRFSTDENKRIIAFILFFLRLPAIIDVLYSEGKENMAVRKSFIHWMGELKLIPKSLTSEMTLNLYSKQDREGMILGHVALGFSIVSQTHARFQQFSTDDLVSEMFGLLVKAVDDLLKKKTHPNPSGYIVTCVTRGLERMIYRERRWAKAKPIGQIQVKAQHKFIQQDEIESLRKELTDREAQIVELVLEEKTDPEIGKILHLTKARIGQIRREMKNRLVKQFCF